MADESEKLPQETNTESAGIPEPERFEGDRRKKEDRRKFACLTGKDRRDNRDRRGDPNRRE